MVPVHSVCVSDLEVARIQKGYPWVFHDGIQATDATEKGQLVRVHSRAGVPVAVGYYNSKVKLALRILSTKPETVIDCAFFVERFTTALKKRSARFNTPYYRLVHAEGDALPGLVIDRYKDTLVCQTTTAGMESLKPLWLEALNQVLAPESILLREDLPMRELEGLSRDNKVAKGTLPQPLVVREQDVTFYVDLEQGQKTGWFYDQRGNRAYVGSLCEGKTVLDAYCYCGGFGVTALKQGAKEVTFVDRSALALNLVQKTVADLKLEHKMLLKEDSVFDFLEDAIKQGLTYEVVIADPPAFIKQASDTGAGLRGYQKLAKLCAQVVAPGGVLFIASCSHHAKTTEFEKQVALGIQKAGRRAKLIYRKGADKDHPVHALLPQTLYLKAAVFSFDEQEEPAL